MKKMTNMRRASKAALMCCAIALFTSAVSGCSLDLSNTDHSESAAAVEQVSVPDVVSASLSLETAHEILAQAGLTYSVKEEKSDKEPGTVIMQYPEKGEKVDKGSMVTLVVAAGAAQDNNTNAPVVQNSNSNSVLVKNFVGQSFDEAKWYYESNGITVEYTEVYTNDYAYGVVSWQSFLPGDSPNTYIDKGSTISFQVSLGSTVNTAPAAPVKPQIQSSGKIASFGYVRASDSLPNEGSYTYIPDNVLNNNGRCWTENKSGVGIGEYVVFTNPEPVTVSSCGIVNGYTVDKDRFTKNGRLTAVTIEGDDASYTYSIDPNSMEEQIFVFDEPMHTRLLKIIIAGAISGTKYDDTCISQINPYQ